MRKECEEEASLPNSLSQKIRPVGQVRDDRHAVPFRIVQTYPSVRPRCLFSPSVGLSCHSMSLLDDNF